jgi:hypothetical protein
VAGGGWVACSTKGGKVGKDAGNDAKGGKGGKDAGKVGKDAAKGSTVTPPRRDENVAETEPAVLPLAAKYVGIEWSMAIHSARDNNQEEEA